MVRTDLAMEAVDSLEQKIKGCLLYTSKESAYDLVLVDAPCSALGMLFEKPDIRIRRQPQEIDEIARIQRQILSACCRYVKPGGRLAYLTCTILQRENQGQIAHFLHEHPEFRPVRLEGLPQSAAERQRDGQVTIFPHLDGMDGFFIALMERQP